MNTKYVFYLILFVGTALTAMLFFSPDVVVHATDSAVNMGNVLDYLLNPKQITNINARSQWHLESPRREIITTQPEGEEPFSKAQLPIQASTEVDGTPVADEYIYYVLDYEGDDAFGSSNEGESRTYWKVDNDLYVGPIESAMNYEPIDINKIAPTLLGIANTIYDTPQVNIYALVSFESSVTADSLYYELRSDPLSFDVQIKNKADVDIDGNLLPDDLFGTVTAGKAWFDSDGIRNVVAASLDFPDTPLAPGQAANTVRLLPDDPDYNVIVELPTTNALGLGGTVIGVVQTARNFGDLFDDGQAANVQAALEKAPGAWLEGAGGEMIGIGVVVLHDDGTKAIVPINTLTVPGRMEIGNLDISLDPGDVRTLGLWRYPLEIVNDPAEDYFSLPLTGQWMPVAMQADYDDVNKVLTAEITGGGAVMPMLVATELRLDGVTPVTAEICAETPLGITGSIPVWMGADPASGLTAAEATARYEVVLVNGANVGTLVFREVSGYAVSGLDVNSENEAYLTVPETWNSAGTANIEFRDKDDPANSVTILNAIDFSDNPPVITLQGNNPVIQECGEVYIDAGATALDACDGDLTGSIITGGEVVDVQTPGAYIITYNVSDSASNAATEVMRTVSVTDTIAPVITLAGIDPVTVECGSTYVDAGASALDACDGDLSASIVVGGNTVNTGMSGTYVITYNVSDSSMNAAAELTRTVHVTDTTPPVLTLLGSNPVTLECGSSYADAGATAQDDCDGNLTGSIVVGGDAVDTGTAGIYVITYNVTDSAANAAAEITRTVNVVDTTPPVLTRIGLQTITVQCGGIFTDPGFTASDVCEGNLTSSIVVGGDPVDTSTVGVYIIAYNVSDSQGNAAPQRTRTVVVIDTTSPVLTVTGDNPATVECGTAYMDEGATATDTCDGDLTGAIVVSNAVNASVAGNYLVTYTVTDSEDNETVDFRIVNVVDTTAPILTLTGDAIINLECGVGYAEPGATATDACDGDLTAAVVVAGDTVNANLPGTYTVAYNVVDGAGLPAVEVQRTVNVADTTLPVVTLNGNAIETVECGSPYNEQGATATDSCSGDLTASIVIGGASVNTSIVGNYTITYNVSDGAANAAAEVARTVNVVDTTAPVISLVGAPDIIVELGGTYTEQGATAIDACDGDVSSNIIIGGDTVNVNLVGIYVVTYNVADGQGNNADEVVRNVYVVDGTSPYLKEVSVVSPNVVRVVFSETMGTGVLDESNYVISGTGRGTLSANPVSIAGSGTTFLLSWNCPEIMRSGGNITITVSPAIQDSNGNSLVPPFTLTDVGGAAALRPTITLSGMNPVNVECGTSYSDAGATAEDQCFTDISASIVTVNPVDVAVTGVYLVTYNVADAAGNTALQATRTVNVVDTTVPVITLSGNDPEIVECGGAYSDAGATAFDDCEGDISARISVGGDAVNTASVGTYVVAYNVTDSEGNAAPTVTRTVYVEDVTPPVITLQGANPVTVECGTSYVEPGATATDVCDGNITANITIGGDSVDTGTPGAYTITYNVADNATNPATEVARIVNVVDSTVPSITLLGVNPMSIECGTVYTEPGATASDSCEGNISGSIVVAGDIVDSNTVGSYGITYNVDDGNGNSAVEVVRTVNVADTVPPSITLIGNAFVLVECNTPYADAGATAFDVCDGVLTGAIAAINPVNTAVTGSYAVAYNVADSSGNNAAQVSRTVEVVDTTPPAITLLGDADVVLECGGAYVDAGATALDNCDGNLTPAITVINPVNTAATGVYLVRYNVVDNKGNPADEKVRTVNVVDTTPPVITLNGDPEVVIALNDTYTDAGATAADSCGGDLSAAVVTGGDIVDTSAVGTYVITYNVSDTATNAAAEATRIVNVVDNVHPFVASVTVLSKTQIQVIFSKNMGAGVLDAANYTVSGTGRGTLSPNPDSVAGADTTYVLSWACPEIMLNGGSITVTVNSIVEDTVGNGLVAPLSRTHIGGGIADAPVITLSGSSLVTMECGESYIDAGAGALDQCGTDLTASIVVNNPVDTGSVGSYVVTYNVADEAGNAAAQAVRTVNVEDTKAPVITLLGDAVTSVECNTMYTDAGATALDACGGDLTAAIIVGNPVNTATVGVYSVTYNVTDGEGNAAAQITRTVNVVDTIPPVINLVGNANVQVECGDDYTDAGAMALDACNGDLTSGIIVNNPVDTAVVGIYSITYNVSDAAANAAAEAARTVAVTDTTLPVITLLGEASVTVECGAGYTDAGATAADNCDGDLSASMVVDNPVNASTPGNYTIRYNVADNEGNDAVEVTRTVVVEDTAVPIITLLGDSEVEVALGDTYTDAGATALDGCDGDLTASILVGGDAVDTNTVGAYVITYDVVDAAGHNATQVGRTVYVVDSTKPYLVSVTVKDRDSVEVVFSKDMGAGVDVPGNYLVSGSGLGALPPVPDSVTGSGDTWLLTWSDCPIMKTGGNITVAVAATVEDVFGNTMGAPFARTDFGGAQAGLPVITLNGTSPVSVECAVEYTDAGVTAVDQCGTSITASVLVDGTVNTQITGSYLLTYNVTDSAGNSAVPITRIVNVVDTIAPVITRNGASVMVVECGNVFVDPGVTATDSCEGNLSGSVVVSGDTVNTSSVGIYTIRYNVSDSSANAAVQRTRTVVVSDNTPPVISLIGNATVTVECGTGYVDAGATAYDACEGDLTSAISVFNPVNPSVSGDYLVRYSVSDTQENNAAEVVRTVHIIDTVAPVITLTGPTSVQIECGSPYVELGATVLDACDGDITGSLIIESSGVDTGNTGVYTVTYNAHDTALNNAVQKLRTVTVIDATAPVITLTGDFAVSIECGESYIDAGATAVDTCDGGLTSSIIVSGTVDSNVKGIYTLAYNVSDNAMNAAVEVLRTVTVGDTQPPEIRLAGDNPVTVECSSGLYRESGFLSVIDLCDGDMFLDMPETVAVYFWFNAELIYEAILLYGENGMEMQAGIEQIFNVNGDAGISGEPKTPFNKQTGEYVIQYVLQDSAGNEGLAERTVYVADTTPPLITLSGVNPATVECGTAYTDAGATAVDDCEGDLSPTIMVENLVETSASGTYTVAYNVRDGAGNEATEAIRLVNVVDTTAPVITLLDESTITMECGTEYIEPGATALDICDGNVTANIIVMGNNVYTSAVGTYSVTYNVSDSAANPAAEVTRTVTVVDTTAPVISLLGDAAVAVECGSVYTDAGATAADVCDGDLTSGVVVGGAVDTSMPGEYTITYNVGDSAANAAAEVTRTVTVVDTTPPVISLLGDAAVAVECGSVYADAGATAADACDGDLTSGVVVGGAVDTSMPGEYTITYSVGDSAANAAAEVTRTVTVVDTTAPAISLVGDAAVVVECGSVYTDAGATAADVCGGDLTSGVVVGGAVDTSMPGEYTITYNVGDSAANAAAEVTRMITVADTMAPVITLVGSTEMTIDCNSVYTEQGAIAMDICDGNLTGNVLIGGDVVNTAVSGTYVITYNVSDSSSNAAAQVVRAVTVLDNCEIDPCNPDVTAPVLSLIGDGVVTVECKGIYTDPGATATDNCDGDLSANIAVGGDAVNVNAVGSYTVTYNVSDTAGNNAAQITRTVIVQDTTPPALALLGAETVRIECKSGYTDAGAMAVDSCNGNLTSNISVSNPVDTNIVGAYTVAYTVSDSSGNTNILTRTVRVMDNIAPVMNIGELDSALVYDADGFLVLEAGTPFIDLESADFTATDICAGSLGIPQSVVEENTPGVLAWAWALDANGEPRWFNDAGVIRPLAYAYDAFTAQVGRHLLVYIAMDGNGNTYPEVDEEGIPDIFDDEGNLDIYDEEGNLLENLKTYLRLVKIIDTKAPEISLVGGARIAVDCGVEFVDPGFSVADNASGDIEVTYSGDPNVNVPGNYVRTYFAVDTAGNEQTLDRLITVRDNCPIAYFTLDVDVVGDGTVTVTPSQDTYAAGSTVILTAAPAYKSRFVNWSGDADGNSLEVTVIMDSDKSVLANFNPIVHLTAISTPPSGGTLVFAPEPVELARGDEVGAWVATYDTGAIVAVTVQPADRFKFRRWEGDIQEPEGGKCKIGCRRELETTITVELDRDKTVEAIFKRKLPWWVYVLIGIGVAGSIAAIAGG